MSTTSESTATAGTAADLTDGYHLVVDALKLNDVRTIYGVVGIPITDVARVAQASGIRYIGFRHESDAGHAAAAAGFLTKKPGICLTVSAPGFLNGLVALANATTNCFPMVQISGSSERHLVDLQRGAYEEMDQLAAPRPFAKAAYRVHRAEHIGPGRARPAHGDGARPAARRSPAVGSRRAVAGPAQGGRRDARRRAPELAARPRRGTAVEPGHQVHPGRHRGRRDGQQPAHRGPARRRRWLGDGGPRRAEQARPDHRRGTVAGGTRGPL